MHRPAAVDVLSVEYQDVILARGPAEDCPYGGNVGSSQVVEIARGADIPCFHEIVRGRIEGFNRLQPQLRVRTAMAAQEQSTAGAISVRADTGGAGIEGHFYAPAA
ncbi:hypothetical protein ACQR35_00130 [Pseudarthrobacter sp. J1738]|uniref:hypothetical protein n=1 Tax=unclassified Pseudarthrobacter TaxID=2647000 RepID=UPI003D2E7CF8